MFAVVAVGMPIGASLHAGQGFVAVGIATPWRR
jgi:hypothetical protein